MLLLCQSSTSSVCSGGLSFRFWRSELWSSPPEAQCGGTGIGNSCAGWLDSSGPVSRGEELQHLEEMGKKWRRHREQSRRGRGLQRGKANRGRGQTLQSLTAGERSSGGQRGTLGCEWERRRGWSLGGWTPWAPGDVTASLNMSEPLGRGTLGEGGGRATWNSSAELRPSSAAEPGLWIAEVLVLHT